MSLNADQLFALLPAIYRTRDAGNGGPLQALFAVMAEQGAVVEENIRQLYDDQFIETCAPWVIPYIAGLIGYNSIYEVAGSGIDSRAEVANTIGYRRRKGTLLALEQVSHDVSGRPAVAVEEFRHLITTESMRHVRPKHAATAALRNMRALDRFGTAFDNENYTIDVRRIAPRLRTIADPDTAALDVALHGPGRFNIPDIAIHLWRWRSWPVRNAPAFSAGRGRYMFSPLGQNMPLFSQPPARSSFSGLTTRLDVPQPIDRFEFSTRTTEFYGPSILLIADGVPVPVKRIVCANLAPLPGGELCSVPRGRIAIDPELGTIQFASDVPLPRSLRVNYSYGFPAEIGGGPYDRSANLTQLNPAAANFFAIAGSTDFPGIEDAVAHWNSLAPGASGIIVLPNYEHFRIDLTGARAIRLPAGSRLTLISGTPVPQGGPRDVIWSDSRVTLAGDIEITGVPGAPLPPGEIAPAGQLLLNGVLISGQILIGGETAAIQITDTTLVPGIELTTEGDPVWPGEPSVIVTAVEASVTLIRAISGPIAADTGGSTRICSSIVDSTSRCCVAYAGADLASPGADLHVEDSTVIGKVRTRTITLASNTIFLARRPRRDPWAAAIWASRRQAGCVRFCFVPSDAITPRQYRCQSHPDPQFITLRYGQPGYALLSGDVPMCIWRGADNGSQMGVYYQIQETEAVRNVQLRAPEYLPVLLESGIFLEPSRAVSEAAPAPVAYLFPPRRDCCDEIDDRPEGFGIGFALI